MIKMSIIENVFQPIVGKPAWNVDKGVGTCLTFEFGDPHLVIREPKSIRPGASKQVQRHFAHRSVQVRGAWHLWIEWCEWKAFNSGVLIGDYSSSTNIIKKVASEFDGQALVSVLVQKPSITTFEFDLGGKLETKPGPFDDMRGEMNDQWSLFEPGGKVLTLRFDGYYSYKLGTEVTYPEDWKQLFH
jgi:hypothetical protein